MKMGVKRRMAGWRLICVCVVAAALCVSLAPVVRGETAEKRLSAQAQFERAEEQRTELNAKPVAERSLEEYKQAAASYRRVYLITSHAKKVPTAIAAVAQLNAEMGRRFGSKYYQAAVDTYRYLLLQYPTSRYREEALLAIAMIQKNNLGQPQLARESFEEFLMAHPRSAHKHEALEALAELAMARDLGVQATRGEKSAVMPRQEKAAVVLAAEGGRTESAEQKNENPPQKGENAATGKDGVSNVIGLTTFNGDDKAQVIVALDKSLQFYSSRLAKPERIFFDLHPARLGRGVATKIPETTNGLVKAIRIAQNQDGVVRVVFEVQGAKEYTAALFDSPPRLVIDFWRAQTRTSNNSAKPANGQSAANSPASATGVTGNAGENPNDKSTITAATAKQPPTSEPLKVNESDRKTPDKSNAGDKSVNTSSARTTTAPANALPQTENAAKKDLDKKKPSDKAVTAAATPAANETLMADAVEKKNLDKKMRSDKPVSAVPPPIVEAQPISAQPAALQPSATESVARQPSITPPAKANPAIEEKFAAEKSSRARRTTAERMMPTPEPTHNGKPSLTRALGLKVGRIVIDAGHGGHDTGTIGATGLMEKDLCLDVALRLGKIIQQRLPGADVIFTRDNDAFVALEDRTAIANQAKADLFLSIHANSSQDRHARGVETYYLNLTNSPEAMAVAARENAFARGGVHDLQDIVAKIARNEKLGESREFAEDVQISLAKRLQHLSQTTKNRGVRKAPFVVLIGADMPSVLAEISFLSNPIEEQLLKRPENRQRIAEGLYQGVVSYLQSVNSLSLNLPGRVASTRQSLLEQSGNQR